MYRIEMIPARQGDCLWIEYGSAAEPRRVLIDGGVVGTYDILKSKIETIPANERTLELMIITHVDRDHIEGAIKLLQDTNLGVEVLDIWYNGWKHIAKPDQLGALQGEFLSAIIENRDLPWNQRFDGNAVVIEDSPQEKTTPGGLEITLLSPTKKGLASMESLWWEEVKEKDIDPGDTEAALDYLYEHRTELVPPDLLGADELGDIEELAESEFKKDSSKANASSIALLAEFDGKTCLLAGDAHAPIVEKSISQLLASSGAQRLSVDAFKVAHHGGRTNLSVDLLKLLDCNRYLISTDGSYFKHPHHETIARIIRHGGPQPSLYFNYRTEHNDVWDDPDLKDEYEYETTYPAEGEDGLVIDL